MDVFTIEESTETQSLKQVLLFASAAIDEAEGSIIFLGSPEIMVIFLC